MTEHENRDDSDSVEHIVLSSEYSGPERREKERRGKTDRRGEHRTDGKISRRTGKGRRKGEKIGLFLSDMSKK